MIIEDDEVGVKKLLDKRLVSAFFFNDEDYFVTPIATAAFYGSVKCVKLLCGHNAANCQPTQKGKATLPPLVAAVVSDQPSHVKLEIIQLLLDAGAAFDWKTLELAAERR